MPATIGGSTERLQGTAGPSGAIDHQTDPPGQLGAVSRPSELTDGRYSRMSQIEQVNIVAMFAAWTTAWRLCVEPPRAHGLLSHSCSWFEPQTPPTARTWRLLRPLRNVAVAIDRLSLRRFNDAEQVRSDEYSQDVAGTTCLSVQDRL